MLQKLECGKLRPQTPEKYRLSGVLKTQTSAKLNTLSKVRTVRPDLHSMTNHFDNEKHFFLKYFVETPFSSYMLFRI